MRTYLVRLASALAIVCSSAHGQNVKMTFGYQSLWATGGEISETLRRTNILALNGIVADFKTFSQGAALGEAYVAGATDNQFAGDFPTLFAVARKPGKVISRTHDWRYAILVTQDFKGTRLADLKGKRFAAPVGSAVFPRAMGHLISAGLKDPFSDLTIINQDIGEQVAALQGKSVDAVLSWDPTVERILQTGLAKPLYMSKPGEGQGWLAVSQEFLDKTGRDGTVRFMKAWIMSIWWASNNVATAQKWFGETSRIPVDLLVASAKQDRYLKQPVQDIKSIDLLISDQDIRDTQAGMDFQVARKLRTNKTDVASLVDMQYLRQAQRDIAEGKHPALAEIKMTR